MHLYQFEPKHYFALLMAICNVYIGYREYVSDMFGMFIFSVLCLVLIFANERLARFKGRVGFIRKTKITKKSPKELVEFLGWFFLFIPFALLLV